MININKRIIIQQDDKNNNNFILIWGGQPSEKYGSEFMKIQYEKSKLKNKNIIFSDWENKIEKIYLFLKKKNQLAEICSVVGFSKGGTRAWDEVHKKHYKLVALLDPTSWDEDLEKAKKASNNTIMIYNLKSFGYKTIYSERMCNLAKILGDRAHYVSIEHIEQPTYFFNKYEDIL